MSIPLSRPFLSTSHSRLAGLTKAPVDPPTVVNAMTVDVEDYFQVSAFEDSVTRGTWGLRESRVCANTERLLDLFAASDVRATFFVLGWVAERFPAVVRRIVHEGHELASHGFEHRLVYSQTPAQFRADLRRARLALEAAGGCPILGYRAPSYSIVRDSMWAIDVLIEEGYTYDSSIYPIRHDRYGIPGWNRCRAPDRAVCRTHLGAAGLDRPNRPRELSNWRRRILQGPAVRLDPPRN